jgi:ferredoxin-type protein NapH
MPKIRIIRVVTASLVILVVVLGAVGKLGYGTICSFGIWQIAFTCPLGFLQMCAGSKELLPQLWFSVALVVLSIILLGRFFCDWVCPTVLLQRGKGEIKLKLESSPRKITWASHSHYAVLGGTLLSSFLFGFPVFCFICPIGLFFGGLFALTRLFSTHVPSLELLIFPAILVLELFLLKSWCRSICPLGALMGIIGSLNRFFVPTVMRDKCLASQGIDCRVCGDACSKGIDLVNISGSSSLKDCTKCLDCYEKCPEKAVGIRLFSPLKCKGKPTKSTDKAGKICQ